MGSRITAAVSPVTAAERASSREGTKATPGTRTEEARYFSTPVTLTAPASGREAACMATHAGAPV